MQNTLCAAVLMVCLLMSHSPCSAASFQDNAVERHRPFHRVEIESSLLNETVDIFIQKPFKYDEDFAQRWRYPVIYVLDAPVGLPLVSGTYSSLVGYNNAPQTLIVGISTANRDRDFLPTVDTDYEADGGGADTYLNFIEKEVIPYVDRHFRTEDFRIIAGHSYGGLFVAQSFYKKPDLFQAHFAFSPSLFWEKGQTVKAVVDFIHKNPSHKNYLYMNMGNEGSAASNSPEGKQMLAGVQRIEKALLSTDTPNLHATFEYLNDEPHQNTPIFGTIGALRGLYPQWSVDYHTSVEGYDSVMAHFTGLTQRYGYDITPKTWQIYDEGVAQLEFLDNAAEAVRYFSYNLSRDPDAFASREKIIDAYVKLNDKKAALMHIAVLLSRDDLSEQERRQLTQRRASITAL